MHKIACNIHNMKQHILLRATIFTKGIPFTQENAAKFSFGDNWDYNWFAINPAQPLNVFSVQEGQKLYNNGVWNAVQKGAKYSILFQGDKIDVLCNDCAVSVAEFIDKAKEYFRKLSAAYDFHFVSRFAFAPTYGSTEIDWRKIFVNSTYKGQNRSDFDMQYVFRLNESINDNNIIINNLVHINSGIISDESGPHNALIYQLDINSFPGQFQYDIATMLAFYDKAERMAIDVLSHLGY